MKRLFIAACIFCCLCANLAGQIRPSNLSADEEREAKDLAVSFFDDFQKTQDLAPLIKKYFVKDFSRRLKICRATYKCGGENRDFWKERSDLIALNATESDFERIYIATINDSFLSFHLFRYFNVNPAEDISENSEKIIIRKIQNEIRLQLRNNHKLIEFGMFGNLIRDVGDDGFYTSFKDLKELHKLLNDYEKYISALRIIELKLRRKSKRKNYKINISYVPTKFSVYEEQTRSRFFDYPIETKMIEVWSENVSIPLKMDLIKEDGNLKVVAVYPPMD